jgi:hypothetical protein
MSASERAPFNTTLTYAYGPQGLLPGVPYLTTAGRVVANPYFVPSGHALSMRTNYLTTSVLPNLPAEIWTTPYYSSINYARADVITDGDGNMWYVLGSENCSADPLHPYYRIWVSPTPTM